MSPDAGRGRRAWVRLDNASNIFLAARSDADPKVFRISAELDRVIDPQLLQSALDTTYDRYRLYRAVLRRGVFWYYLQDSDLTPVVTAENQPTCAAIYQPDHRRLLFRVVHHRRRISLEVFHALSDGTGALWFLSDLVTTYVDLQQKRRAGSLDDRPAPETPDEIESPDEPESPDDRDDPGNQPVHELTADSFAHYFRRRSRPAASPAESDFSRAAAPAALTLGVDVSSPAAVAHERGRHPLRSRARVHRITGTRTPDNRTRAVELTMPAAQVLALARAEDVALTMYLTGLFIESVRQTPGGLGRDDTVAVSVPVNLRQFFPSTSPRNFFATIRVHHTFGIGPDDLGAICRNLDRQFRPKATPEALESKLRKLIRFERMPALRIVPRPVKDVILSAINAQSNRGLTIAVSNLGRVTLPAPADDHVRRLLFHVSAVRPQLCAVSHAGVLALTFTSPFVETTHIAEYARLLTSQGVDVSLAAARVTDAELAGGGR